MISWFCAEIQHNDEIILIYRFGEIISLIAYRDIVEGEEILVNYGYNFQVFLFTRNMEINGTMVVPSI